jgi:hypothetical protein
MSIDSMRAAVVCLVLAVILCGVELEAQCSMCRTLLATTEGQRLAAALRSGIWILLVAPFTVFGVIAVAALRSRRRLEGMRTDAPARN